MSKKSKKTKQKKASLTAQSTARRLKIKVKTAKGRKLSSTRWLERQLNDPFVAKAKEEGYRSRAVYKLLGLQEKYEFLKPGMAVVDLGAAPGGWSQLAAQIVGSETGEGKVVAIDIQDIEPIPGVTFLQKDFMDEDAPKALMDALGSKADIVMSDMASFATGHKSTDHLRIIALVEAALEFACDSLKPGGVFIAKVLQGGTVHELLYQMRRDFEKVRHVKPEASRADSSELFVVATGFRKYDEG